jgi:hypothetical protein
MVSELLLSFTTVPNAERRGNEKVNKNWLGNGSRLTEPGSDELHIRAFLELPLTVVR